MANMKYCSIKETNLQFTTALSKRSRTSTIVVHHVGDYNNDNSALDLHNLHLARFGGIAYHFVIRKDGSIERGRPMDTVGSHCRNNNSYTVGINVVGDFMSNEPTAAQVKSLILLVASLCAHYGLDPKTAFKGHKDIVATDCPGDKLYVKLPYVIDNARGCMGLN